MTPWEAGIYFFLEFIVLPWTIPGAIFWVCYTWWIYALWLFYEFFLAFEHFDAATKAEEDIGLKQKRPRKRRRSQDD